MLYKCIGCLGYIKNMHVVLFFLCFTEVKRKFRGGKVSELLSTYPRPTPEILKDFKISLTYLRSILIKSYKLTELGEIRKSDNY